MARQRTAFTAWCPRDHVLLTEAAVLVALLHVGLATLSCATTRRLLHRRSSRSRMPEGSRAHETIRAIAAAVIAVARRLPLPTTCLVEALAVEAMLRRRGFAPALRIGVREPGSGATPLEAHAWVECAGAVVVGGLPNLAEYAVLSRSKHE
jgi:Transglutaminase-like superfamily